MEKENKTSERRSKARQTLVNFGKWLFLLVIFSSRIGQVSVLQQKDQKKNGGSDEDATRSTDLRKQVVGERAHK